MQETSNPRNLTRARIFSALVVFLAIDQIFKALVRFYLPVGADAARFGPFAITHFENSHGPFSLQISLFILIPVTLLLCLLLFWRALKRPSESPAIACVLSGGISNLIDRLIFQSTTDYLGLPFGGYWNLADVGVLIGLCLLIFSSHDTSPQNRS